MENLVGKLDGKFGWKMLVNGCEIIGEKIVASNLPLRLSTTYTYDWHLNQSKSGNSYEATQYNGMGRGTWKWPVRRFEMDGNISVRWDNSVVNGEARVGCGSYFCWLKRGKVGWGDVSQIIHKGKEMKPPTIISFPNHS